MRSLGRNPPKTKLIEHGKVCPLIFPSQHMDQYPSRFPRPSSPDPEACAWVCSASTERVHFHELFNYIDSIEFIVDGMSNLTYSGIGGLGR